MRRWILLTVLLGLVFPTLPVAGDQATQVPAGGNLPYGLFPAARTYGAEWDIAFPSQASTLVGTDLSRTSLWYADDRGNRIIIEYVYYGTSISTATAAYDWATDRNSRVQNGLRPVDDAPSQAELDAREPIAGCASMVTTNGQEYASGFSYGQAGCLDEVHGRVLLVTVNGYFTIGSHEYAYAEATDYVLAKIFESDLDTDTPVATPRP